MQKDLLEAINKYKARTPEFEEIMRKFQISQDEYERALRVTSRNRRIGGSTYTLTHEGQYNVNVSSSNP